MSHDQSNINRRIFTRIPFRGTVALSGPDGNYMAELLNLSLKGVLVARPAQWNGKKGQQFKADITLSDGSVVLHMNLVIAHMDQDLIGFCCTHSDIDSVTHIRRILEFNLGDEDKVIHEVSSMVFGICSQQADATTPEKKN